MARVTSRAHWKDHAHYDSVVPTSRGDQLHPDQKKENCVGTPTFSQSLFRVLYPAGSRQAPWRIGDLLSTHLRVVITPDHGNNLINFFQLIPIRQSNLALLLTWHDSRSPDEIMRLLFTVPDSPRDFVVFSATSSEVFRTPTENSIRIGKRFSPCQGETDQNNFLITSQGRGHQNGGSELEMEPGDGEFSSFRQRAIEFGINSDPDSLSHCFFAPSESVYRPKATSYLTDFLTLQFFHLLSLFPPPNMAFTRSPHSVSHLSGWLLDGNVFYSGEGRRPHPALISQHIHPFPIRKFGPKSLAAWLLRLQPSLQPHQLKDAATREITEPDFWLARYIVDLSGCCDMPVCHPNPA
ncbi:uncharacterized protein BDR25DRAFT_394363 [Lindgomyces ingoldianus]|uniref:Uncharacterized protein n=1 Tax=Lindgomyces ingoldianus TaxID=673940 RepID=A0ACB6QQQ9_9PLEO|nr:uncharacterized protein BDR25DRAFT_394363 [Lindgomyces ingoldianus]KAF2469354.1 hypothetical protein BDR25DRAFT_394363 [Lindgomyces ingoldianus]